MKDVRIIAVLGALGSIYTLHIAKEAGNTFALWYHPIVDVSIFSCVQVRFFSFFLLRSELSFPPFPLSCVAHTPYCPQSTLYRRRYLLPTRTYSSAFQTLFGVSFVLFVLCCPLLLSHLFFYPSTPPPYLSTMNLYYSTHFSISLLHSSPQPFYFFFSPSLPRSPSSISRCRK